MVKKCTKCGYTTSIAKTGHDLLEVTTKEATSTSVGYKDVYCKNAGCDYSEKNVIIPMK